MIDSLQLVGIVLTITGVYAASFGAVYHKMINMQKDISELSTKMGFVYDNLSIALDFKNNR